MRTNLERLEPMSFRTQLQDTRANAQGRIIGNKHRKGLGTSRAATTGSGRRFCFFEFECLGYEGERSGTNHWKQTPQGT